MCDGFIEPFCQFYIPNPLGELIEMIEFDSYMFYLGRLNHPPGYNLNRTCFSFSLSWSAISHGMLMQVAYNSMIAAFSAGGLWEEALEVFAVLATTGGAQM